MLKDRSKMKKVNQECYGLLFATLLDHECTAHELVEVTGLHLVTMYDLIRVLRRHKVLHICGWEQDSHGRDAIAIFKLGKGKDKPRHRMTRAQIAARYREKKANREKMHALAGAISCAAC